jgi:hypothetical protein
VFAKSSSSAPGSVTSDGGEMALGVGGGARVGDGSRLTGTSFNSGIDRRTNRRRMIDVY